MPKQSEATVLNDSFALPSQTPYKIQIGTYTGARDLNPSNSPSRTYQFRLNNGHILALTLDPTSNTTADIHFLTSAHEDQVGRSFEVVSTVLEQMANEEPPSIQNAKSLDFGDLSLPSLSVTDSGAATLRSFSSAARAAIEAIEKQALHYARIMLGRIPAELRNWADNDFFNENQLAERLKEYGCGTEHGIGESPILSTKVRWANEWFKNRTSCVSAMQKLKIAWHGICDVEIRPHDGGRIQLYIRPIPAVLNPVQ